MGRSERTPTFTYGLRHRYAFLPTIGFLVVVFAILLLDPSLLWTGVVDERSHQAGLILSATLAVGFAAALVARWTEPFRISLAHDALVATPLIGSTVRVPYDRIVRVAERPRTFLRGHVELDVRAAGRCTSEAPSATTPASPGCSAIASRPPFGRSGRRSRAA